MALLVHQYPLSGNVWKCTWDFLLTNYALQFWGHFLTKTIATKRACHWPNWEAVTKHNNSVLWDEWSRKWIGNASYFLLICTIISSEVCLVHLLHLLEVQDKGRQILAQVLCKSISEPFCFVLCPENQEHCCDPACISLCITRIYVPFPFCWLAQYHKYGSFNMLIIVYHFGRYSLHRSLILLFIMHSH